MPNLAFYGNPAFLHLQSGRVREVQFPNITRAEWGVFLQEGTLSLCESSKRLTIRFNRYTIQEQLELIRYFRQALNEQCQTGWEKFEARCIPVPVNYDIVRSQMFGHLRFAVKAWAIAIPFMYAILIWPKMIGGLPNGNWVVIAIAPFVISGLVIGPMWFMARGELAKSKPRETSPPKPVE